MHSDDDENGGSNRELLNPLQIPINLNGSYKQNGKDQIVRKSKTLMKVSPEKHFQKPPNVKQQTDSSHSRSEEIMSSEDTDESFEKGDIKNKNLRQSLTTIEIG